MEGSASSSRTVRIAAPISTTGATRNAACRCSFHGWKFDIDGNCIDLPTSPPESAYKDTIKLLAYPTREWGEMIWVYMGPRELMPELPQLEMALVPASSRFVTKKWQDCNWVQSLEGAIDTSHFSFLHKVLATDEDAARKAMARRRARRPVQARRSRALGAERSAAALPGVGPRDRAGDRRGTQDRQP